MNPILISDTNHELLFSVVFTMSVTEISLDIFDEVLLNCERKKK